MHHIKAVFLDMDGTILNHYNEISSRTTQIIKELRDKGVLVFIATGRSLREIKAIAPDDLEVDGIVSANGMVASVGDKKIVEHALPQNLVSEVIERARKAGIYYEVHPSEGHAVTLEQDKQYITEEIRDPKPDSVGINEWLSRKEAIEKDIAWEESIGSSKYLKFYFFSRSQTHIKAWIDELEQLKQKTNFTTSTSSKHNVELMVANVNKATGIKELMEEFGLSSEDILVMGDSNNDIPMFRFAGYAVAMKNAEDSIKEIANDVTAFSCDEDGVYHYLREKFQLNG